MIKISDIIRNSESIVSPDIAADLARKMLDLEENEISKNQEHIWIIGLDNKNRPKLIQLVSLGGIESVMLDPKVIFCILLRNMCSRFIVIHNHPSGNPIPSKDDRDLANKLLQAGQFLQLPLLDFIIIGEEERFSFNEAGLIT